MSYINKHFRQVLGTAENVGSIEEISQGDWIGKFERIYITGKTHDGRDFTLSLEIENEDQKDGN